MENSHHFFISLFLLGLAFGCFERKLTLSYLEQKNPTVVTYVSHHACLKNFYLKVKIQ